MTNQNNYTRSDIMAALHAGVRLVVRELVLGERDRDLIRLVDNAAEMCLDNPGASFDQMVRDTYDYQPDEVREWWSAWT